MELTRLFRHLLVPPWRVRRFFPAPSLAAIEKAIADSEVRHGGQIRFAVEHALSPISVWRGQTARERAIEVFSDLRIWDTEYNCGVLIYLLLADRDVEIVGDRGIHAKVGEAQWQSICATMEKSFRHGDFLQGSLAGIAAVTEQLIEHFPARGSERDELANRPILL